jgi:hypothetical protein
MILGMSIASFTLLHVIISLVGIVSGLVMLFAMMGGKRPGGWTELFLVTTVATSVTGFLFPIGNFGPPEIVGIVSLVVLAVALLALYGFHLAGAWRPIYIISAVVALYLNVFVGVAQAFQKLSFLQPLAPTQSEPPFLAAQVIVMAAFILFGFLAVRRFHPGHRGFA